ncbi:MAG: EF-hand domain-containing protein [Sphingorhabdus sp.]
MLRILTASSILALAAIPAVAQQADPMAQPAPSSPSTSPSEPSTSTPAPSAPTMQESAPPADAAAAPSSSDRATQVAALVDAEFPTYDADKNGELSQSEFKGWVMALHSKAEEAGGAAKKDQAAKDKWAKDAFTQADADKSKKISKAEMNKFLEG